MNQMNVYSSYYFLIGCCLKVSGNGLKFGKKSKQKKNDSSESGESGLPGIQDTGESQCPGIQDNGESFFAGVQDTRELWLPGVLDTGGVANSHCPGHHGVVFWMFTVFFQTSGHFLQPLKQQSIKKQFGSYIYYSRTFGSCFKNFPNFIISVVTPGRGVLLKCTGTYITHWKFAKNENGSRRSFIGPGGAVWWKKNPTSIMLPVPLINF